MTLLFLLLYNCYQFVTGTSVLAVESIEFVIYNVIICDVIICGVIICDVIICASRFFNRRYTLALVFAGSHFVMSQGFMILLWVENVNAHLFMIVRAVCP